MKKCPNCGAELDDDVRFCPDCGEPLAGRKNRGGRKGIGCGGIFKVLKVLFFIVIAILFLIAKKNGGVNLKAGSSDTSVSKSSQVQPTQSQPKSSGSNTGGVDPDLKAWLDSYESFMDQYVTFMKSYDGSTSTALLNYASMVSKYADYMEKLDEWDTEEMSSADYSYYLTVVNRVNTKLLSVY